MVKDASDGGYRCEACGLRYASRTVAAECEAFCEEHDACDPDILSRSLDT